jgi:hypothetical protein
VEPLPLAYHMEMMEVIEPEKVGKTEKDKKTS